MYLFILSPPYSGSTVLYKLIATSPNVSTLLSGKNPSHVGEGSALFHLTEEFKIGGFLPNRFNPDFDFPMDVSKKAYESIWDLDKEILCDKSPPTICRSKKYEDYYSKFSPTYFISLIRNPYCCRYAMKEWVFYARFIKQSNESLSNIIHLTYEEVTGDTDRAANKMIGFMKDLEVLDTSTTASEGIRHPGDKRNLAIRNYNVYRNVEEKNNEIAENPEYLTLMDYFGYEQIHV